MGKTFKQIAEEIGVSKQAVYKRAMGKLKNILESHFYTEYNHTCLDEEGIEIIKRDFKENPSSLPRFQETTKLHPEQTVYAPDTTYGANQSAYVSTTEKQRNISICDISNSYGTDTSMLQNVYSHHTTKESQNAYKPSTSTFRSASDTNTPIIQNTYASCTDNVENISKHHTDTFQNISKSQTYNIQNTPEANTSEPKNTSEQQTYDIRSTSETNTYANKIDDLDDLKEKIHQLEIELTKAHAENDKHNEVINQLNTRLDEKDNLISEQKIALDKSDEERRILTASLFRNNEIIERIMSLSLTKRIFGWKDIRKTLINNQEDASINVEQGSSGDSE